MFEQAWNRIAEENIIKGHNDISWSRDHQRKQV